MMGFRNYHMTYKPVRGVGARRIWKCEHCGAEGTLAKLSKSNCTHVYEKCKHCGGCEHSNECKPDCAGIAAILADPDLYVIGGGDE